MDTSPTDTTTAGPRPLRIAIEGCGHGTLDGIYASIQKGCEVKSWDSVDLVIICGDFQAVRDRRDLNVTAMPAKYRELADFHQYYWGSKKAPFLTLFIGGNHEASNHLWELYYGGWAAPNIYYLGAANVIQFGPLKIAGMSGIWKGYDYQKPHFERLPYSSDDMYSIYHVRELDVRKLLAYRSQVDIGLSHDWPRGIEWLGNHRELFARKHFLKEDAEGGKLGNVAANLVLNHLRPRYWFSAHLHVRYAAIERYADTNPSNGETIATTVQQDMSEKAEDNQKLVAWHNFGSVAREDEMQANAQNLKDQQARREEANRTGVSPVANYTYNETYKRVKLEDGFSRTVTAVSTNTDQTSPQIETQSDDIPQVDGCCASLPLKRHHQLGRESVKDGSDTLPSYVPINVDGASSYTTGTPLTSNPDAIDLDMSDDEQDVSISLDRSTTMNTEETPLLNQSANYEEEIHHLQDNANLDLRHIAQSSQLSLSTVDQEHGRPHAQVESVAKKQNNGLHQSRHSENDTHAPKPTNGGLSYINKQSTALDQGEATQPLEEVSEEMRAQLAALSTKFVQPDKIEASAPLPHPEDIQNKETKFLALSKCAPGQDFLQLLEIPMEDITHSGDIKAMQLHYDPEWLAILRVFAQELSLGGTSRDQVPAHRGDTYYRERIIEEEKWIDEHILKRDLLRVPENFSITLPEIEGADHINATEMPDEATNPQTAAFCQLIGIENKFDFSDADREARRLEGPSQSSHRQPGKGSYQVHRGGRGGRGGGFHRGRGGRGGRGRGRRH